MLMMPSVIWRKQSRALSRVSCLLLDMSWPMMSGEMALPRNFSMKWQSRSTLCSKESRSVMVLLKSAPEELSLARYVLSQLNRMF